MPHVRRSRCLRSDRRRYIIRTYRRDGMQVLTGTWPPAAPYVPDPRWAKAEAYMQRVRASAAAKAVAA